MAKDYSPFTPGVPVSPDSFAGKATELRQLMDACEAAQSGRFERTFIIGDRGIGKSSICNFVREAAETRLKMLGVHAFLGGARTVEEMCRRIFEEIARASRSKPWYSKLADTFRHHVKEVGLFGISVSFEAESSELRSLASNLPSELDALLDQLKPERTGMVLILDDINGLSESQEFADWLKSFVDKVGTAHRSLPLHLILAGLPERRESLIRLQPSLNRVFTLLPTSLIGHTEAAEFFHSQFSRVGIKLEDAAADVLVRFSGGYPAILHEIGDAAFRLDSDGVIAPPEAYDAVLHAADNVGRKFLDDQVLNAIKSEKYKEILKTIVTTSAGPAFSRQDVLSRLGDAEQKIFSNFISKMKDLGVLAQTQPGRYRFTSALHWLYYIMRFGRYEGRTTIADRPHEP